MHEKISCIYYANIIILQLQVNIRQLRLSILQLLVYITQLIATFQFSTVSIIKPQQHKHMQQYINKEYNLPVEFFSAGTGHMSYDEKDSMPAVLVWLNYV